MWDTLNGPVATGSLVLCSSAGLENSPAGDRRLAMAPPRPPSTIASGRQPAKKKTLAFVAEERSISTLQKEKG